MLLVLWCNGSTRDFGSLRDCSIQSGTTYWIKCIFFHTSTTACEGSCAFLLSYLHNLFFFSTACDKSLSLPLKQLGNALHTQI